MLNTDEIGVEYHYAQARELRLERSICQMSEKRLFFKYVSQNILGMVGISLYILADTFFIAQGVGADGITALNLVLPIYSLIFAVAAMIGTGASIRFAVARSRGSQDADAYFMNAILCSAAIGFLMTLAGLLVPDKIVALMGGDASIVAVGSVYTRIFMAFTPFFMWNSICNAFVRNDGAPTTAMMATLLSSLFNIVADYVLVFPLGLGMAGAALATAISPILGILICGTHFCGKKNTISFRLARPSLKRLAYSCQVGVSAFTGEISSGVTMTALNFIILGLAGNVGVAAYGVVANTSIVALSAFNGVSNGCQPLISSFYGRGDWKKARNILRYGILSSLALSSLILMAIFLWTDPIASIFNREGDPTLASYARRGLRLYFVGFLFAGINTLGAGALSATEAAREAFAASVLRGFVAILACAFGLSALLGLDGVWMAFPAAELLTLPVTAWALRRALSRKGMRSAAR